VTTRRPDVQAINAWLAAIVEASSDAIISYTLDGIILTWNPAAERMFGYPTEEAVAQRVSLITPPEYAHEPPRLLARLQAGETVGNLETIRMRKDGTRIPVMLNLAPIKAPDGIVRGISATVRDLTEREGAEERFRGLLDSAPDPILGVDHEGRIVFANLQTEKMFGYERGEMLRQHVELLLPNRLKAVHARHREVYHAAPTPRPMGVDLNLLARRKDGSEFPVEISLSPLETRTGVQVISAIRDVTHRQEIEIERQRLLDVAERARGEAEAALQVRTQAERLKDDLTNMVVHDLKNPVNGITMQVRLLLRKGSLSETQHKNLNQIERTCRELLRLIGNVLEIAKIEAGQMPVTTERIVLAELVDEVAAEYGPVANEVGRRLTVAVGTDLPPAIADRALLKRVLVNLVANALRHSGSTEVRIEAAPGPARGAITIRVLDSGQGIPDEDQASIFEKFRTVRGDSTADTGLGLPFCKLAIERMGGQIALTSVPGRETAFAVTLPVQHADA
jgi:PAS domain S-box-containing protein